MSTDSEVAEAEGSEAESLVSEMKQVLAAWDPWGLSSHPSGAPFGVLIDENDQLEELSRAATNKHAKAALIIYQGKIEDISADGLRCAWRAGRDITTITFELSRLGKRNATLVLAHGTEMTADTAKNLTRPELSTYGVGANLICVPAALRQIEALRFSRVFLHEACTHGAPIGELLRNTLALALEAEELEPYPFTLRGDPAALLPFAERYEMRMHVTRREKSMICDLAKQLESSPMIPIAISWHEEISDMDSEFLRRLEEGAPEPREPEIWPISLCAIGRALFDRRYSAGARKRLWILQVALYSAGGNRLIVRYEAPKKGGPQCSAGEKVAKDVPKEGEDEEIRGAATTDPWVIGFSHNSFEGTLARMCLRSWSNGANCDEILKPDRFVSCSLSAKTTVLGKATPFQVLLWGADLQENAMEELPIDARTHLLMALAQRGAIDLDREFLVHISALGERPEQNGLRLPMIFLVLTRGEGKEGKQSDAGGRRAAGGRPPLPPQSFFALRELQRSFRGVKALAAVEDMPTLIVAKPHYLRSVDSADLDVMSAFIAKALEFRLWEKTDNPGDRYETTKAAVQRKIEEHLYLTPEMVARGIERLRSSVYVHRADVKTDDELLSAVDTVMWDRGRLPYERRQEAEKLKETAAKVLLEVERLRGMVSPQNAENNELRSVYRRILAMTAMDLETLSLDRLRILHYELSQPDPAAALARAQQVLNSVRDVDASNAT